MHPDWVPPSPAKVPFDPDGFLYLLSESPHDSPLPPESADTFNEQLQTTVERLSSMSEDTSIPEQVRIHTQLLNLAENFFHIASAYGKAIISEMNLPPSEKTIKPDPSFSGIAGGTKYLVHGILFKFAVDTHGLFGSDAASAKAAKCELKGLIHYYEMSVSDIYFPMIAIVDYLGHRLVATSLLPINSQTLIYGSSDGGRTVHNQSCILSERMAEASRRMNLKPHVCGHVSAPPQGVQVLSSPTDLEGHRGTDGRFYLIDFARIFPPEAPLSFLPPAVAALFDTRMAVQVGQPKNPHLYQLLRPELVRQWPEPLCSDAFSGFIAQDPEQHNHNMACVQATSFMLTTLTETCAKEFLWAVAEQMIHNKVTDTVVSQYLHRRGVNLRHIGIVLRHIPLNGTKESEYSIRLLLLEALFRVLKHSIFRDHRLQLKRARLPSQVPFLQLIISQLNSMLGKDSGSEFFWGTLIPQHLAFRFNIDLAPIITHYHSLVASSSSSSTSSPTLSTSSKYSFSTEAIFLRSLLLSRFDHGTSSGKVMLFRRLSRDLGVQYSNQFLNLLDTHENVQWDNHADLDLMDILSVSGRVVSTNLIASVRATLFRFKAQLCPDRSHAFTHLSAAAMHYEEALKSTPNSASLLRCLASTLVDRLDLLFPSQFAALPVQDAAVIKLDQIFLRAIDAASERMRKTHTINNKVSLKYTSTPASLLADYASFLSRCSRSARAEDFFLRALENDASSVRTLCLYSQFLVSIGSFAEAERFMLRATRICDSSASRKPKNTATRSFCSYGNLAITPPSGKFPSTPPSISEPNLLVAKHHIKPPQGTASALRTAYVAAHNLLCAFTMPDQLVWSTAHHPESCKASSGIFKPASLAQAPEVQIPGGSVSHAHFPEEQLHKLFAVVGMRSSPAQVLSFLFTPREWAHLSVPGFVVKDSMSIPPSASRPMTRLLHLAFPCSPQVVALLFHMEKTTNGDFVLSVTTDTPQPFEGPPPFKTSCAGFYIKSLKKSHRKPKIATLVYGLFHISADGIALDFLRHLFSRLKAAIDGYSPASDCSSADIDWIFLESPERPIQPKE